MKMDTSKTLTSQFVWAATVHGSGPDEYKTLIIVCET